MGEHIRLESVGYNPLAVEKDGSRTIDPLVAKRIGKGGYATTYRVQAQPGLPVGGILKVFGLYPETYRVGERLRRKAEWSALYDEYDMLCALDGLDGHVPQAYASSFYVEGDGEGGLRYRPAFLMEEIGSPAEPLYEVLSEHRGPFEAEQVATFGLRMLDVLDLLAEQGKGIAHADLSPTNVYVRRSPDGRIFEWVYLIDFGQAKYTARGVTPSFVSGVQPRMGTVEYCAPELIPKLALREDDTAACREHNELYRTRSDVTVDLWSLGALMYLLALRKAPSYSVEYATRSCASGLVSGFWRGDTKLENDDAFRVLIEEKHRGLDLPDYMSEENELLLGQAIALCTAWDPRERDRLHIRRLLKRAAEGADDERFMPMTHVPELTPALKDDAGWGTRVEPGIVFAGMYKLTAPDGAPFSDDADADLFVFGDSEQAMDIREYRYRGVTYAAERVGSCFNISSAGWDDNDDLCDLPWQDVRVADFLTEVRPTTTSSWFGDCSNLTELLHIDRLDTSAVTDMSDMFWNCSKLSSIDLSGFDTSSVTDMSGMFSYCFSLTTLDVSKFDTSKVTSFRNTFSSCTSLSSLDLSGFDTSSVTDMSEMFCACSKLSSLDLSGFDTSSVADMRGMFSRCSKLSSLDLSGFDTSSVADMSWMFCECSSLSSLDLSGFDTSSANDMSLMFFNCRKLASLDVSGFDASNATDLALMFTACPSLVNLKGWPFPIRGDADIELMFDD